jgi:outer membrane lipoprotein carrier protein
MKRLLATLIAHRRRVGLYVLIVAVLAALYRYRLFPERVDVLLDYFLYMSVATTITPLPTPPVIIHAATKAPVFIVAAVGALGTVIAYLIEYALVGRVLALDRLTRVRKNRVYLRLAELFDRLPFVSLTIAAFLPLPVDGVRLIAIARRYDRPRYAMAAFLGRLPRYALIAALGYSLKFFVPPGVAAGPEARADSVTTAVSEPALEATLERLDAALAELDDARGQFHQERWSPVFDEPDRSRGELWYRRAGDLVLHYREPADQEMYIDSTGVWIHLVKEKQAQRYPFNNRAERDAALAVLWQPSNVLARLYEVNGATEPPPGEKAGEWLRLVPRDEEIGRMVASVYMRLAAESGLSDCVVVEQRDGDRVRLELDQIERNPRLPEERFRFEPPPGVEVVRF